jgi:hypothetical protein
MTLREIDRMVKPLMLVGRRLTLRRDAPILLLPIARLSWPQTDIGSDDRAVAHRWYRHIRVGWIGSQEGDRRCACAPNQ